MDNPIIRNIVLKSKNNNEHIEVINNTFGLMEKSCESNPYLSFYNNIILKHNAYYHSLNINSIIVDIYIKIVKATNAFKRLWLIYKLSKIETIIDTDVLLTPLSKKDKNVITIVHSEKKYLFYIFDLSKIIYNSLTNAEYLFSNPLPIKNPYNNLEFDFTHLCNIYFHLKFKNYRFNELLFKFYICNFDLKLFFHSNQNLLRNKCIYNYMNPSGNKQYLHIELVNMINNYNNKIHSVYRISIHPDFPIEDLLLIMKPYLYLYIQAWYSLVEYENINFTKEVNHRLFYFQKYNPKFGRIYYRHRKSKLNKLPVMYKSFNTYHIPFKKDVSLKFDGYNKYLKLTMMYKMYLRNRSYNYDTDTDTDTDDYTDTDDDSDDDSI